MAILYTIYPNISIGVLYIFTPIYLWMFYIYTNRNICYNIAIVEGRPYFLGVLTEGRFYNV